MSTVDERAIEDVVLEILSMELKEPAERIVQARSLKKELGMDSVAAANAIFMLEDRYGIEIELEEGDAVDSFRDIINVVRRALVRAPVA